MTVTQLATEWIKNKIIEMWGANALNLMFFQVVLDLNNPNTTIDIFKYLYPGADSLYIEYNKKFDPSMFNIYEFLPQFMTGQCFTPPNIPYGYFPPYNEGDKNIKDHNKKKNKANKQSMMPPPQQFSNFMNPLFYNPQNSQFQSNPYNRFLQPSHSKVHHNMNLISFNFSIEDDVKKNSEESSQDDSIPIDFIEENDKVQVILPPFIDNIYENFQLQDQFEELEFPESLQDLNEIEETNDSNEIEETDDYFDGLDQNETIEIEYQEKNGKIIVFFDKNMIKKKNTVEIEYQENNGKVNVLLDDSTKKLLQNKPMPVPAELDFNFIIEEAPMTISFKTFIQNGKIVKKELVID